jgi:hypothetical protein
VELLRRHKRRRELAEWWPALVDQPPQQTVYVAWDNATSSKAVLAATLDFFRRCNAQPAKVLSVIGSHAA